MQGLWVFLYSEQKEEREEAMSMIFRQKDFWTNVPKGTEVTVKKADNPKPMKLYFDELREFTDYGLEMLYVCLQKDPKDLGNRSLTVPLVVDEIEDVLSVAGQPLKEYRKERRRMERRAKKESASATPEVSEPLADKATPPVTSEEKDVPGEEKDVTSTKPKSGRGKTVRKKKEYGFTIEEKDGKFICPCGSIFGRRDTAIYVHRTRHIKN